MNVTHLGADATELTADVAEDSAGAAVSLPAHYIIELTRRTGIAGRIVGSPNDYGV